MRDQIHTDRLILRQVELRDAPAFATLASDIDIARMTSSFPHPFPQLSVEFKILYLRANKRRGMGSPYAVTRPDDDAFMGIVDLFHRSETAPLEIAYWIGRPYWGHGYVTEACRALLIEAQETFGARDITAGVYTDNLGSVRVLEKLGFQETDHVRDIFSMARLTSAPVRDYLLPAGDSGLQRRLSDLASAPHSA